MLGWSLTLRNLLPNLAGAQPQLSWLQDESDNRGSALLQGEGSAGRVADLEGAMEASAACLSRPP